MRSEAGHEPDPAAEEREIEKIEAQVDPETGEPSPLVNFGPPPPREVLDKLPEIPLEG